MVTQSAVLLTPGSADAASATVPCSTSKSGETSIYASLYPENSEIRRVKLPISSYLAVEDAICVVHTIDASLPENQLANEACYDPAASAPSSASPSSGIRGPAYILYEQQGRAFDVKPDWDALHSACYEGKLAGMAKGGKGKLDGVKLAELFQARRTELSHVQGNADALEDNGDEDEGWEDEDVEKPREKKEEDSDDEDDDEDAGDNDEEEDEDSEGSFEDDESELESDDDDDPRKKALLEMIKQSITKDGKLDLERCAQVLCDTVYESD